MARKTMLRLYTTVSIGLLAITLPLSIFAREFEKGTSYYEDDAWYDISEWLDGNDYNPTDEVFWRWDDEKYDWTVADNDQDNDALGYGYDRNDSANDWYYDYDSGRTYTFQDYNDKTRYYDLSYSYYDYDGDGFFDAVSSTVDTDSDDEADKFTYYSFNTGNAGNQSGQNNESGQTNDADNQSMQKGSQQKHTSSKQIEISGTVEKTKRVKVRNGPERLVAQVSADQGNILILDLGPANQFGKSRQQAQSQGQQPQNQQPAGNEQMPLKQGEKIKARGPLLKVGDKEVLVAHGVTVGNQQEQPINRSGQQISGQIHKMKTVKVRGQDHQLAIIQLKTGKQALIDLGPADKLQAELAENDQIQVSGVAVKVQDRLVFVANSVSKDGTKVKIERTARKDSAQSS